MCAALCEQRSIHRTADLAAWAELESRATAVVARNNNSEVVLRHAQEKSKRKPCRVVDPAALAALASFATPLAATHSDDDETVLDYGPSMADHLRGVTFVRGIGDEESAPVRNKDKSARRVVDLVALAELASSATLIATTAVGDAEAMVDYGPDMADHMRGVAFVRGVGGEVEVSDVEVEGLKERRASSEKDMVVSLFGETPHEPLLCVPPVVGGVGDDHAARPLTLGIRNTPQKGQEWDRALDAAGVQSRSGDDDAQQAWRGDALRGEGTGIPADARTGEQVPRAFMGMAGHPGRALRRLGSLAT